MAKRSKIFYSTLQKVKNENIAKYGELTCELCEEPILAGELMHYDHVIPVSKATKENMKHRRVNGYLNLQVSHKKCNEEKGDKIDS